MTRTAEERLGILETETRNIKDDITDIKGSLERIETKLDDKYATKEELEDVRNRPSWAVSVLSGAVLFLAGIIAKWKWG